MTLSERMNKEALLTFRRSLYQRKLQGETLVIGESYIFLNGQNVEERKATAADVMAAESA